MLAAILLVLWSWSNGLELHTFPPATTPPVSVHVEAWIVQSIELLVENRANNAAVASFGPSAWDPETTCVSCLRLWSHYPPLTPPVILDACETVTVTVHLAAFDGVVDFGGPSGRTLTLLTATRYAADVTEPHAVARLAQGRLWVERASSFQATLYGGSGAVGSRMRNGARVRVEFEP